MIAAAANEIRVLAIDPTTHGYGFAVLEGPADLIDWGVKEVSENKLPSCLESVTRLIDHYGPTVLVVETPVLGKSRRCERVRVLIANILNLAINRRIRTRVISRRQVRDVFSASGARTKHEIANAIANSLPELGPRLPRFRYPWMPQDERMAIFDAIAMALTFFELNTRRERSRLSALGINHNVEAEEENTRD